MFLSSVSGFLLAALLIELTPGPNMAYLAMVSALEGRKSGLITTSGVALGLAIIGIASVLGLAALVQSSPILFQGLRWGGAVYIIWLAAEAWTSAKEVSPGRVSTHHTNSQHFRRGLITNLLNPKAGLFFIAILPGFTRPADAFLPQALVLIFLYVALATAVHLVIVVMAARASKFLSVDERRRDVRKLFSVLLLGVAIWFLAMSR